MFALTLSLLLAAIGNADIVKLVKAGLSPETIEAKIAASETKFDTSTDALVALASEGVPDRVIRRIIEREGVRPAEEKKAEEKPAAEPAATPAKRIVPTRRYDVHVGNCEDGELRIDAKAIKATRCGRQLDFELAWPAIEKATYNYGFRGLIVLKTKSGEHRLSTTTPAEARKIVEHIRTAAPALSVAEE